MKSTAVAPSNIAFIKFIGKTDEINRLPANSSISMCLSGAQTITTIDASDEYVKDSVEMEGIPLSEREIQRVVTHLDFIRKHVQSTQRVKVVTKNNFPTSTGIASSASGFAALTAAAMSAFERTVSEKDLSILARHGSGSAARSIPDGFVLWEKGNDSESSYAHSIYPPEYWDLCDLIAVIEDTTKPVSTSDSHRQIMTSPFYHPRLISMDEKVVTLLEMMKRKDFRAFGSLIEMEALNMHAVMMTATPSLLYLQPGSIELIQMIWKWRRDGLEVYFTIDAGPNIHILCEAKDKERVLALVRSVSRIKHMIESIPSVGTRIVDTHLF